MICLPNGNRTTGNLVGRVNSEDCITLHNCKPLQAGVTFEQEPVYSDSYFVESCNRSKKKQDQNHSYQPVNQLIFFWTSCFVTSLPTSPQVLKIKISIRIFRNFDMWAYMSNDMMSFIRKGFLFKSWRFKFYPSFPSRWAHTSYISRFITPLIGGPK